MPEINSIAAKSGARPTGARQILVVEDDIEVSRAVSQMLHHLGYIPLACGHAQEALGYIQVQEFDLMLVDYRMPDMTGLDLILMLRQTGCNVPVIIITGYGATAERMASENFGVLTILKKPITMPQLARALEDALQGKPQEHQKRID